MSSDLYGTELAQRLQELEPTTKIQPSAFDGFLRGTGMTAMRALARTGSAIDLLGGVGPIYKDWITGGTELQDRYFREHDEVWGRAVEYWTPNQQEVGVAGQITGELLTMIPMVIASPGLAIGSIQVGEAEELVRRGAPAKDALAVGSIQAAGLGLGIYVPILGRTLAQRLLVGGAGFNVLQGTVTRGLSAAQLKDHPELAAMYGALDPTYLTLDVLLGLAFGGMAHVSPQMRAQGAESLARLEKWLQAGQPGVNEALATMRQAQHLAAESLPGKPVEPQDEQFHVERTRRALEQLARNERVDVSDIPEPRVEPMPEQAAEREAQLAELVRSAEEIRQADGLAPPPEPTPPPPRLVPDDLTLVHHEEQARALGQAVENRLLELKMSEAEARANAAIWEAFFETTSRKYGVRVDQLLETYGIDVRRMARDELESLMPEALTQGERAAESARYKRWIEGQEYEGRLWGGAYDDSRITGRMLAKDAPMREAILQARERYNQIRREFDLPEVKDWSTRPPDLIQKVEAPPKLEGQRDLFQEPAGGARYRTARPEELTEGAQAMLGLESYAGRSYSPVKVLKTTKKRAEVELLADTMRGKAGARLKVPLSALFVHEPTARAPGETLFQSEAKSQLVQTAKKLQARWYSELERQITAANMKAAPAKGWKEYLKGLLTKGVKADELKWSGIEEWLDLQGGRVSKDQVLEFLKKNGVKIEETVYGGLDVQKRNLNDPEITPAVAELQRLGYPADVSPDGHVIGFVTEPGSWFDGDFVTAAEIRQAAREANVPPDPSVAVTDEQAVNLERAADLAQEIEAYWHGEALPPRTGHELGAGQRVEAGEVFQGTDGEFTGPGWVYRYSGSEYYILEGAGPRPFRVPWMGAESAYQTKALAEQALWERITEELQLPGARGEQERATKFSEYQLPGGENYRELTLRLPEAQDDALPKGYAIKEQPRPENYQSEIDKLTEHLRQWQYARGYAPQSADELRMSLEAMGRPRPAHRALDIEWLRNFEGRWEIATQKDRYLQFVLVRPDGSGRTLHVNTKDDAIVEARKLLQQEGVLEKQHFTGSHFPDTDVLAHVRFNERTDAEGKRVLFVEEIQSDWAQKARKSREAQVEELAKDKQIPLEQAEALVPREAGFFHEQPVYVLYYETPRGRVDVGYGATPEDARASMDQRWGEILKEEAIKTRREPGVQKGAVPAGPFVGKTEQWAGLVLKRMIRWAAENGFERIAWTTGEQQVTRYQHALRKAVDSIDWKKTPEGVQLIGYKGAMRPAANFTAADRARIAQLEAYARERQLRGVEQDELTGLRARQGGRNKVVDTTQKETELSDAIGKAMADQIRNDPAQSGTIEGENLKIDDTGMAGFYERILPSVAKDVLKKLGGGKLAKVKLELGPDRQTAVVYQRIGRELPEFDDLSDSAREAYGGAENFPDGEPPMLGQTRIMIDGQQVDVEVLIAPHGVHFIGLMDEEPFELLVPKDRMRSSQFRQQDTALNAVDEAWGTAEFWNNIELISGELRTRGAEVEQPGLEITPELRERALAGMPLFQAPERGAIRIGPQTVIALFEKADASTFVHESAHLFLQITRDMANRGRAPLEALDDWGKLRTWLKIEGAEITREQQEKFATSFERYLAEGKAPSEELRSVFQQFRDWLIQIYRSLANIAEELPDEIRGVMDRMLASQRRDPTPKAEGPPLAEAEPPPPPGEAGAVAVPEAQDWSAQTRADAGELPEGYVKRPLSDPAISAKVDVILAYELGWAQIGGRRARADIDMSSGRPNFTEWIPHSEVWPNRPAKHLNEDAVRRAVAKARAGERLGKGEQQMVDYLVDIANKRAADVQAIGGPEEWNASAKEILAEGFEPSTENVKDADLVARAAEIDELAVERAAQKYENDDAAFMAEMRRILGKGQQQQAAGQGEGAGEGGQAAAGEAPGAEAAAEPNPLRDAAIDYVNRHPETLIPTGKDADGNTTYETLREYVDAELIEAQNARDDIRLIEAAVSCLLGGAA